MHSPHYNEVLHSPLEPNQGAFLNHRWLALLHHRVRQSVGVAFSAR
jgi:hypothetical protein